MGGKVLILPVIPGGRASLIPPGIKCGIPPGFPGGIVGIPPGILGRIGGISPGINGRIPGGIGGISPGINGGIPPGTFHNPGRDPSWDPGKKRRDPTWDEDGIPGGIGGIPHLILTWVCKTFGDRAFYKAGPDLWNHLPLSLRNTNDLQKFKKDLKTHLLRVAFSEH